ncbi:OadG-related small transporter subunit [Clostridium peptidivorans]|nr:OadG-related small transporter subunit [Clostridium peptidivorans]
MNNTALINFKESLNVLINGMIGIFTVIIVIFIIIKLLIKVFPEKS